MKTLSIALVVVASLAALIASARTANADAAADASRARALFYEARKLIGESHYDEACPKLEESERLDPGIGTEYNLADCYEHVGKLVSALALFERVVATSHDSGQDRHEAQARKRALALSARVPFLVVEVPEEARVAGLEVTRDGEPLAAAAWSTPVRVEPGRHAIAARAAGRVAWEATIDVPESQRSTVRVPLLPMAPASPEPPPIAPPLAPVAAIVPPPPRAETPARYDGRGQRTIGIVVGAVGVAGVVVGGVLGALSLVARNDAKQWCNVATNGCSSPDGVDARASAVARGNASTAFFVAGGALVATGVVVWWTAPSTGSVRVGLQAASGPFPSIAARGEF
jgi:hypothetical protein